MLCATGAEELEGRSDALRGAEQLLVAQRQELQEREAFIRDKEGACLTDTCVVVSQSTFGCHHFFPAYTNRRHPGHTPSSNMVPAACCPMCNTAPHTYGPFAFDT